MIGDVEPAGPASPRGDRPEWRRLEDGELGVVVTPRLCALVADIITQYHRLHVTHHSVPIQTLLLELRDVFASIDRAAAYVVSPERNDPGNGQGPPQKYVSTMEVARRSGLTQRRVQQLAKAGEWPGARKVGRTWVIPDRMVGCWTAASSDA